MSNKKRFRHSTKEQAKLFLRLLSICARFRFAFSALTSAVRAARCPEGELAFVECEGRVLGSVGKCGEVSGSVAACNYCEPLRVIRPAIDFLCLSRRKLCRSFALGLVEMVVKLRDAWRSSMRAMVNKK